ncbi:MAG: SPASM domain-containing protein [bacterium]|nr:SPASM domain-containing protein [bacterium]
MHISKNSLIVPLDRDPHWKYVIFNSLSGNVNLLDDDYFDYLTELENKENPLPPDPEKDARLLERGYVFREPAQEEERRLKVLNAYEKKVQETKINIYGVYPYNRCPHGCSWCSYGDILDGRSLSEPGIERLMVFIERNEQEERLKQKPDLSLQGGDTKPDTEEELKQKPHLSLHGGDTMPDTEEGVALFKKLTDYLDRFGLLRIFTYGFNLERYKDVLMTLKPKKVLFSFQLLENPTSFEPEDLFSKSAEESFDWLRMHGFLTSLVVKVTEENVGRSVDYVNYFIAKGYVYSSNCHIYLRPTFKNQCSIYRPCLINYDLFHSIFTQSANSPQMEAVFLYGHSFMSMLQALIRSRGQLSIRTNFCAANSNLLIMDPKGHAYTCYNVLGDPNHSLGDVVSDGALDKSKLEPWRKRQPDNITVCSGCPAKYLCGGGCAYDSLVKKGSISEHECPPLDKVIKWAFELLHEDFMDSARYTQIIDECGEEEP